MVVIKRNKTVYDRETLLNVRDGQMKMRGMVMESIVATRTNAERGIVAWVTDVMKERHTNSLRGYKPDVRYGVHLLSLSGDRKGGAYKSIPRKFRLKMDATEFAEMKVR